jgi:peptidoglycan hydrolase-like protein with peptidoglycan-binding domain
MLKGRIGTLAITGITIMAAALVTVGTTAASAATTTGAAPGHVMAPRAADVVTGCVTEDFSIVDENYYEPCVYYEQFLLNNLRNSGAPGPNQLLATDGYYGPLTTSDVRSFQQAWGDTVDGITGPQTWESLCWADYDYGWHGPNWQAAGCGQFF